MHQPQQRADHRRYQHPGPQVCTLEDGQPAGECACHHDALDARVEYAGSLAQQHPEGYRISAGRGDAQHRNPEGARGDDVVELAHRLLQRMRYRVNRPATRMASSEVATITSAR